MATDTQGTVLCATCKTHPVRVPGTLCDDCRFEADLDAQCARGG